MTVLKKQRARRVASDEAHAWARSLQLNNPNGKSVLRAVANYVNGEGSCFVGLDQLAEDTDLSIDTVRRRLVWLEQIGAVVRMPQWLDANGRRNGEGRGKRSSDDIRLLLDTDIDAIEAAARGEAPSDGDDHGAEDDREFSPSTVLGLNSGPKTVSPQLGVSQPSQSCEGLISEPEPEDSPLSPLGEGTSIDFDEFRKTWDEPIGRHSLVEPLFAALTSDERKLICKAASGFRVWQKLERKQGRKPPNYSAQVFLRERKAWTEYAVFSPDMVAARSVHEPDSIEARAIAMLHDLVGRNEAFRTIVCGRDRMVHWSKPVTAQLRPFAQFGPWQQVKLDRNGAGAWERLMNEVFVAGVVRKHFREGSTAPWPFPRSTTGKIYTSSGPPQAGLSDDDVQDFK